MPSDQHDSRSSAAKEVERLVKASGRTQREIAAFLSRRLPGVKYQHYHISRMIQDERRVTAEEMDALRELSEAKLVEGGHNAGNAVAKAPRFGESQEAIPLYGVGGGLVVLTEEYRVAVIPIHPGQRGAKEPFAFQVPNDTMGERMRPGEIAYAVLNRLPTAGQPCLVELAGGECALAIYEGQDAATLHGRQLKPAKALSWPLREVKGVHAIVGVSFA